MISGHEPLLRLSLFLVVLVVMILWEQYAPRRRQSISRTRRWTSHLGLATINNFLVRLVLPLTALQAAELGADRGWGLLHVVECPAAVEFVLAVVALDFVIYLQHVLFHRVPLFWRLHRVHHADLELDATSGVRFHTFEILLSMLIKIGAVLLLGGAPLAVLVFEVLLNATSMFNHGNVFLPERVDRMLRLILVTPDMHRIHHSVHRYETDSNFGFNLPVWDRLLGTYRAKPVDGHEAMTLGLREDRDPTHCTRLDWLLAMPFRSTAPADQQGIAAAPVLTPEDE